ncbi:MAG: DNA repair protein RadA [Brevinema sp.]
MAKTKSIFCCKQCGHETPKWLGKCPSCSEWNTFQEIHTKAVKKSSGSLTYQNQKPEKITDISSSSNIRTLSGLSEWDRVLNGTVPGQAILISGEPGIGKSTLLLQIAQKLAEQGSVLYINGEESSNQVKLRAERLGINNENLYLYAETEIEQIIHTIKNYRPLFLIADSLQTLHSEDSDSSPGSLTQLRECTHQIVNICKTNHITALLVSHVTKDGAIAGPKAIEHLVDTVLFLESDTRGIYRVLRTLKNRFGSTEEVGFFEMHHKGLVPADDLSEAFLSIHEEPVFGSVVYANAEGRRVFPLEIQVLCHHTNYNYPRRTAEGLDYNRLTLLSAVIEKQLKIPLSKFDIYANITGGLEIKDRAVDLALVAALCSSFKEQIIDDRTVFIGEIGLTGEIRPVRDVERRVKELSRLGMKAIYIPYSKNMQGELQKFPTKPIRHIRELFSVLFGN